MIAKIIERPIGCYERNLDRVLYHLEKEANLNRLVNLLQSRARGRSRIKVEAGKTEDGSFYIQFWRPLRRGWRILAHFEIKPIEEVENDKEGACEGSEGRSQEAAAEAKLGQGGSD